MKHSGGERAEDSEQLGLREGSQSRLRACLTLCIYERKWVAA